ncbi:MAG: DUF5060 domain-containing protein [Bacteroidota bacterium]
MKKSILFFLTIAINIHTFSQKLDPIETTLWSPYAEWALKKQSWKGNPFDVSAHVEFQHQKSGETITTGMFYAGDSTWKFRFSGTKPGKWTYRSKSNDPTLNGVSGEINVKPNPNKNVHGFLTNFEEKWGWQGTSEAFVPQYVMYKDLKTLEKSLSSLKLDVDTFLKGHGFTGFHIPSVSMGWFDIDKTGDGYDKIDSDNPNPDLKTFEILETLIVYTHMSGGAVHIWAWGDESRKQTPLKWGANGLVDKRLQRYIAARLGPLPGWSMGYGFDLWEWTDKEMLNKWHSNMHEQMGWFHFLGARAQKNQITQISEKMDYSSYEQHRPDYEKYVETINKQPGKPSFSEDRFRIREDSKYPEKDYTPELTLEGLWNSTMAGGVANIWGNLEKKNAFSNMNYSAPYPNRRLIKTYFTFFFDKNRFLKDMKPYKKITDNGIALADSKTEHVIILTGETNTLYLWLDNYNGSKSMKVVDTRLPYNELAITYPGKTNNQIVFPYKSVWAVALGYE